MELVLATRKSMLAQTQTETVMKLLKNKLNIDSKKLLVVTEGDKRLDVTLDKIGGKGLFTKEIEIALLEGKAHAAVHSMKDVPYDIGSDFELVAIPEREDVRDVLVSQNGESLNEVILRENNSLNKILNQYKNKKILIVGHSTALAALFSNWCEVSYAGPYKFNEKEFFDGKWNYCETFKLTFDDYNLIDIKNIK